MIFSTGISRAQVEREKEEVIQNERRRVTNCINGGTPMSFNRPTKEAEEMARKVQLETYTFNDVPYLDYFETTPINNSVNILFWVSIKSKRDHRMQLTFNVEELKLHRVNILEHVKVQLNKQIDEWVSNIKYKID